jgi:hypothetical protein
VDLVNSEQVQCARHTDGQAATRSQQETWDTTRGIGWVDRENPGVK